MPDPLLPGPSQEEPLRASQPETEVTKPQRGKRGRTTLGSKPRGSAVRGGGARQEEQMLGSPARGCPRVPAAVSTHTRSLSARIWGLKLQPVQPSRGQEPRERKDAVKAALSLHQPQSAARWCALSATPRGPPGHRAPVS
ncbi:unnamed protein product [Rangifer tarandus platyrhynchus]|uniref:Uncharacterized protein n=1 Tax=Rangifer tarandus platyrhynchus TaxID=3082113 RepID=A0ABN8Y441_RANTA|nr:unnamed protein product [Rangifer tarandus platyrhynchus]